MWFTKSDHITTKPVEGSIDADPTTAAYISLEENTDYVSNTTNPEVISTNYNIFKSITRIQDDNLSDSDKIFIKTNEDIITTPIISGFEDIIFEVAETFTGPDSQFYVDLSNLSGFDQIVFSQSNLPTAIKEIAVMNAQGSLYFNRPYSDISATVKLGESLSIESNNDAEIKIFGAGKDIILDGNGDALNISTSNHGNIEIIENSSVFLTAPNATGDLSIISNGNISIENVGSLLGNITLSGVGTIALDNASSLIGKLEVDNMRASAGNDIILLMLQCSRS